VAISTFIGRSQECGRVQCLVDEHRMVTIVGPGGMGKTRIVDELTPWWNGRFPGGVRRSELAPISPGRDVGIEIAGALGFPSLQAMVVGLQEVPSLLVLDNCEHLRADVAAVSERLLAEVPTLRLVATSREPLGVDGEEVFVLGPLALPGSDSSADLAGAAATRLFADRARAAGARLEESAAELAARAELCRRLDGVPLAIELAAARARALSAVEILSLLDRRFDLLQRDAPVGRSRHRSLRAAIDTSYALLDAEEQAVFRALGVFRGPFSARVAHDVTASAGTDLLHTIDVLARLVDRSLLIADVAGGTTRYRLLESLRDYAIEQARAAGEWDALMERFVAAMAEEADRIVATGSSRWSSEVLASVLLQFEALGTAIDHALANDADRARAFRLMLPLWAATHQGRAAEVAAIGQKVLAHLPGGAEPLRAEATSVAASSLLVVGRIEPARAAACDILEEPSALPIARVIALRTLGLIANDAGDFRTAVEHFERGSIIARQAGLTAFERELAVLADSTDCSAGPALDGALQRLTRIAEDSATSRDSIACVWARIVIAHHLVRAGRVADARAALETARAAQADFVYPFGSKAGLRLTAALDGIEHGWEFSRPAWLAAVNFCASCGDLTELALTLRDAAAIAERGGDHAARDVLLGAVPPGVHPIVLGGVFAGGARTSARQLPDAAASPTAAADLQRVRELLGAAPNVSAPSAGSPRRDDGELRLPLPDADPNLWSRSGDAWTLRFAGKTTQVRHKKGLEDLATLLSRPDQDVHCLELIGGSEVGGGHGPVLDDRARRDYKARVAELQGEIDRAQHDNDLGAAERAEAELDALVQQLSRAFGLGGRERPQGSAAERARSAVAWRIRAAIRHIRELHPELARHLDNAIRTGTWCSYHPETATAWHLSAGSDQARSS